MPWWAPLGGMIGAFAVIAGLLFVDRVGAGAFAGLTITANILTALAIGHSACCICRHIR
jgi:transporter family-2 protein